MEHKEQGYRLFQDDHVKAVRPHPGGSSDSQCLFLAEVKPSMKTTGSYMYSTAVALSKSTGHVIGTRCKCKAGAGGCRKHVAALLCNIVELRFSAIPEDKTCTNKPQ